MSGPGVFFAALEFALALIFGRIAFEQTGVGRFVWLVIASVALVAFAVIVRTEIQDEARRAALRSSGGGEG